jgi:uncharacterized protein YndB with AHSA1/START domain
MAMPFHHPCQLHHHRHWKHAPARVFEAFAKEEAKRKWFAGPPGFEQHEKFRFSRRRARDVKRQACQRHGDGVRLLLSRYRRANRKRPGRIIYSYVMHLDGNKISVSQAAIEIIPEPGGTKLVLTEYGDYLDGYDDAGKREHGTNWLIDLWRSRWGDLPSMGRWLRGLGRQFEQHAHPCSSRQACLPGRQLPAPIAFHELAAATLTFGVRWDPRPPPGTRCHRFR